MITYYNAKHHLHQGKLEMFRGEMVPCFEVPARADFVLRQLQACALGPIEAPAAMDEAVMMRVHAPRYVQFLRGAWNEWLALDPANADKDAFPSTWPVRGLRADVLPGNFSARMGLFSFDAGTPLTAGTWAAAREGAACAQAAALALGQGHSASFALTRPPGHHAGPDYFGGYCFLNNAAIAAQTLRDAGCTKVAVLDVDYHHGNGTQSIFEARADVFFASIHGDPRTEYPFFLGHADERGSGAGLGYNLNLPLARGCDFAAWRSALQQALQAINRYGADALVVSLGVDTFVGDPISGFALQSADYLQMGQDIATARLPTAFVFEGGYAVADVGVNAVNVLQAFAHHAR